MRVFSPYQGQAGHEPDTAITRILNPIGRWIDMPGYSNNVAGGVIGSRVGQKVGHFTVDGVLPPPWE